MESDYAIGIVILSIFGIAVYFVPTIVVLNRRHPNRAGVIVLNILLGWTVAGWILALIWAAVATSSPVVTYYRCIHCENKTKIKSDFCPVCGKNTDGYTLEYLKLQVELKLREQQAKSEQEPNS